MLRKGQILGALIDSPATNLDDDPHEDIADLLDDQLMEETIVKAEMSVSSEMALDKNGDGEEADA